MSAPKHPSIRSRARDAKRTGVFRVLSSTTKRPVPPWPLVGQVGQTALLEVNNHRKADLEVKLEATKDGRTRGRLRRQLDQLEIATAKLSLEIEQAADAERSLWADLWAMPQAEIWAESHSHREVAQYVRWKIRAESGDLKASVEARMLSDRLGLNPLALLRLRAEIEQVDKAQEEGQQRRAATKAPAKKAAAKKKQLDDPRNFLSVVGEPSTERNARG